jgi:ribonuclease J
MDHCGNISLLNPDIPIVASPTSISILKALRDVSTSRFGTEIAYYSPKHPIDDKGRVLASGKENYIGRTFFCTTAYSESLENFLSGLPGQEANKSQNGEEAPNKRKAPKKRKQLNAGQLCNLNELNLPFEIEAYDVDHSIFGATAYILRGDSTLAYTGDFRLHGKNASKTKEFIDKAKDASILIIEGTRVERADINDSEETVFQNCLQIVEDSEKLVVADFSARNFERFETFKRIAEKTGRQLVVTAKDIYMLHGIECADGICRIENLLIYNEPRAKRDNWETSVVKADWNEKYVTYDVISSNPEKYILCFSFYDLKHLLDIQPQGGSYIYSSSEAFSEEQEFDFRRLWKWLKFFNFNIHGFELITNEGELQPSFMRGYHVSGHVSKSELEETINTIDPDCIIPVHTTNPQWFKDTFEKVILPTEGYKIDF